MKIPQSPPSFDELFLEIVGSDQIFGITADIKPVDDKGRYLHWDEMRDRTPPDDVELRQWWFMTSMARRALRRELPLRSVDGAPFQFCNVERIQELVHRIEHYGDGQLTARHLVAPFVEEAVTSSQLAGATTSHQVASHMLVTGRTPADPDEQMIVRNFEAMEFAQKLSDHQLSPGEVLELQRILTADPDESDRNEGLRTAVDGLAGVTWGDGTPLHHPPEAEELPERLDALCRFANGEGTTGFIHPMVRAVIVHFCLAYDHPFTAGNGRTARALFYRSMMRENYSLARYISISAVLLKAPARYPRSYLLTETDSNDITYFVIHQLEVIERAVKSLHQHVEQEEAQTLDIERLLDGSPVLNGRQIQTVRDAVSDLSEQFTIHAQMKRHGVTYQTARTDLLALERHGLFSRQKVGRKFVFRPEPDLSSRLEKLGSD
jgi:Fic family protein